MRGSIVLEKRREILLHMSGTSKKGEAERPGGRDEHRGDEAAKTRRNCFG